MADETFAPRPVGTPEVPIVITGKFLPLHDDDQPVLVHMPECADLFLPLFTDKEQLEKFLGASLIHFDKIKQVDAEIEFLDSLPFTMWRQGTLCLLRVIVDQRHAEGNRMRFLEIQRMGSPQ
jgi:hypothetical protein